MVIFLTGATGFVGKNLVGILKENKIYCLVRNKKKFEAIKHFGVKPVWGDLTSPGWEIPADTDVVIHNAGLIRGRRRQYYEVNTLGTAVIVRKAKKLSSLKKFIFISSQAASGPGTSPKSEEDFCFPVSDYGRSKLMAEEIVRDSGLPYIILRPVAVYGPGDKDIFSVFKMVKTGFVFLPAGKRFLNLVNVDDLCFAIKKAAESPIVGKIFFVAHPEIITYEEFAKTIAKEMSKRIFIIKIPEPLIFMAGGILSGFSYITGKPALLNIQKVREISSKHWIVSVKQLEEVLDFHPRWNISDGVKMTLKWYNEKGWL